MKKAKNKVRNSWKENFLVLWILILVFVSGLFLYFDQELWAENVGNLIFVIFALLVLKETIKFLKKES